jgi:hypothetical protein
MDKLVDSYYNDGYIYCLSTGLKVNDISLVKIGKIGMKVNDTEQQVINKLLRRYNTYYPDYEVIQFVRVGNCHKAELSVFELLKDTGLHYKREIYYNNHNIISNVFDNIREDYPSIQDQLLKSDSITISTLNNTIRKLENN